MRSYSGVSAGGFLPSLRGYCSHAVLGRYGAPMSFAEAYARATAETREYGSARPTMTYAVDELVLAAEQIAAATGAPIQNARRAVEQIAAHAPNRLDIDR